MNWIKFIIILSLFVHCNYIHAKNKKFVTHVTVTTYNPIEEQCGPNPLITASGKKIDVKKLKAKKIKYCAVSRDLLWCLPFGSIIHIEGHGYYEVVDTMHKRYNCHIDILQHPSEENFKKEKIKIIKVK